MGVAASVAVAETTAGRVRGAMDGPVHVFKGVPYAASTEAGGRFQPPRPAPAWAGVRQATAFGCQAPQAPIREMPPWAGSWFVDPGESEDCLVLNVWTPGLNDARRPVMVWLHGGGFAQGSAASSLYDGRRLAERGDVVVVTVNHRLNIFGYLHLSTLGADRYAGCENLGQQDLIAALGWVRDNIAAFGGDPSNVTIFGESGGGGKVCTLMAMPAARGLFHRAIVQSGPYHTALTHEQAEATARAVLAELDLTPERIDEIQGQPAAALLGAMDKAGRGQPLAFSPMKGAATLPRHPFSPDAPDISADVPLLIGWNRDEVTTLLPDESLFRLDWPDLPARLAPFMAGADPGEIIAVQRALRPDAGASDAFFEIASDRMFGQPSRRLAVLKAAQGRAPAYFYKLEWAPPAWGGKYRSGHSFDLPLVFDNLALSRHLVAEDDEAAQRLADAMSRAWVNFARSGDPNGPGLPAWSPYEPERRPTMRYDIVSRQVDDPAAPLRAAIDRLPILPF